jgi:hypothetical protein
MVEVNTLSAAAFEAVAEAQATYGVPDRLIAKIAQCSDSQITRNRKLVGWSLRKVTTAYLRGQAPKSETQSTSHDVLGFAGGGTYDGADTDGEQTGAVTANALRATIERLLWKLNRTLAIEDVEDIDPQTLKRIEGVGNAAKHLEKLLEMLSKAQAIGTEASATMSSDPHETARVLQKIEKRVHELAEQKARDIVLESIERNGDAHGGTGMDDQRSSQSNPT